MCLSHRKGWLCCEKLGVVWVGEGRKKGMLYLRVRGSPALHAPHCPHPVCKPNHCTAQVTEDSPKWQQEFTQGTRMETYRVALNVQFEDMTFDEVTARTWLPASWKPQFCLLLRPTPPCMSLMVLVIVTLLPFL